MKRFEAKVNGRLLAKANSLFTGTVEGRVIGILQNARRAGATRAEIANEGGYVTVRDNSRGISDFVKLLDVGGSGWGEAIDQSEESAGIGLVCLAGREVTVRSRDRSVTIRRDDWLGKEVAVKKVPGNLRGVLLRFRDEAWTADVVEANAIFCGMAVTVDGETCETLGFVSEAAQHDPKLGCRIEVTKLGEMGKWHDACRRRHGFGNVLVNFHGKVVSFEYRPVDDYSLGFLVDLDEEPADPLLMLSPQGRMVENEAFEKLKAAIELEACRYVQRQGFHQLPHRDFLRAKELGVELPEAVPTYGVGLLEGNTPKPVPVTKPEGLPLAKCYRLSPALLDGERHYAANAHLLGALGKPDEPFVPVRISECYDGYSWAKLPTIEKVDVATGEEAAEFCLGDGWLVCVESLAVEAHTSDGKVWSSPVCMAMLSLETSGWPVYRSSRVFVTRDAEKRLRPTDVLFHLGGYAWAQDPYDKQEADFEESLGDFWVTSDGPDEQFRKAIIERIWIFDGLWRSVHATCDGVVKVEYDDGVEKVIRPSRDAA